MPELIPENIDSKLAPEPSILFVALLCIAGISPGIFLTFSLFVMGKISFFMCVILTPILSIVGLQYATKTESNPWKDERLWIIFGIQFITIWISAIFFGLLRFDHVASPGYFFGLLFLFVISCLLSHFVGSWIVRMKLQKTTNNA